MIVVTGASGQLGRRVVELVLEQVGPGGVAAASRTPGKLADLAARGVQVRGADFDEPATLPAAFAGAGRLLLVSTDEARPDARIGQHRAAVAAAVAAGVGHVGYTSVLRPEPGNPAAVAVVHRETERLLADSGLPWTVLRNGLYADLFLSTGPRAVATGVLAANAGDGAAGWVTREDCAAAAAGWLVGGGRAGERLDVTGPAALDHAAVARLLGEVTGRPVRYQPLSDDEAVRGAVAAGLPAAAAEDFATFGRALREGWFAAVTPVVRELSGRAPTALGDLLRTHRDRLLAG